MLAGCGREVTHAKPPLWRVRDADTTIWLLGSIHVLPPRVDWQDRRVMQAIDESDALLLELPDDPANTSAMLARMGRGQGLPPLAARVAPARRETLARAVAASEIDATALDGMKSWAAALALGGAGAAANGASRDNGVEALLADAFSRRRRPVGGLETAAAQFAAFDALPEAAQRVLLDRAIMSAAGGGADYRATLAAWAAGDTKRLAATLAPEFAAAPALQRALVTERNARWADAIAARMKRPGRVLVAVGAGHLVGKDSLVDILRARGLRVERVE